MDLERRSDCELEECIVETKEGRYLEARQSHSPQSLCGDQCSGVLCPGPPGQPGLSAVLITGGLGLIAARCPASPGSPSSPQLAGPACGQRTAASGAGSTVTSVPRSSQVRTETDRRHHPHRDLRSDAQRVDWQHSVTHNTECTLVQEPRQNVARRVSPQVE